MASQRVKLAMAALSLLICCMKCGKVLGKFTDFLKRNDSGKDSGQMLAQSILRRTQKIIDVQTIEQNLRYFLTLASSR